MARRQLAITLVFLALGTGAFAVKGLLSADGALAMALVVVIGAAWIPVIIFYRLTDWHAWIKLAATPAGLHIVVSPHRTVFVPWEDVVEIGIA
ncbi:MAG: hypothetical protein O7A03_04365, partial [Alphaproteobacteria bacterium]|nr:hypothetical protein [Alphaproteobacteria bacterium]